MFVPRASWEGTFLEKAQLPPSIFNQPQAEFSAKEFQFQAALQFFQLFHISAVFSIMGWARYSHQADSHFLPCPPQANHPAFPEVQGISKQGNFQTHDAILLAGGEEKH